MASEDMNITRILRLNKQLLGGDGDSGITLYRCLCRYWPGCPSVYRDREFYRRDGGE